MKFLHIADVHLGSKMSSTFTKDILDERKKDIRKSFVNAIKYAIDNGIENIILAGDIFDHDKPLKKDKEFFFEQITNNESINFFYLKGNHDKVDIFETKSPNLYTFNNEWTTYELSDGVTVSGIEVNENNATSFYDTLSLNKDNTNIVILHGELADSSSVDKLHKKKLKDKHINYLALGHIHKYEIDTLDDNGIYAYSGCLEPRGFDEIGPKGFIEFDTAKLNIKDIKFRPYSIRVINELDININNSNKEEALSIIDKQISNYLDSKKDIMRLVLKGNIDFNYGYFTDDLEMKYSSYFYNFSIKNATRRKIDTSLDEGAHNLQGEFISIVKNNDSITLEEKERIINLGLTLIYDSEYEL
ncbi:MAG: metallophosphoesterase family protein [Anaeroplasmataceae bacterium]